ncbi:hypothetical protein AAG906_026432 [Vitis piasezkii]
MAQPIQPVDRLYKNFLSPSGLLFLVKVEPQPVEDKVIKYREKLLTQLIMSPENEVRENVYQAMDQ